MRDAALVDHSGHQTTARAVRLGSRVAGLAAPGMCALVPATGAQTTVTLISHRYPALEHYAKVMDGALPGPGQTRFRPRCARCGVRRRRSIPVARRGTKWRRD